MLRGLWPDRRDSSTAKSRVDAPPAGIDLLGVRIDCLRRADLINAAAQAAAEHIRTIIVYVNVHCLNVAQHDPAYSAIVNCATFVYCDGTGVRLGARLAGKVIPERMTGADWIHDLCRRAVRDGLRLFLLAGEPGISERAAALLRVRYPGLRVVGTLPGYAAGDEAIDEINRSKADILLVGMGTPTQEKWIAANQDALAPPVIWAVGALFDFVSGKLPRGPRSMTDHGLEWLCRLAAEPRKLWRRYLIGNPVFLWHAVRQYWLRR